MKIFYIFISKRKPQETQWIAGEGPNSLLYGLTELRNREHEVDYSDKAFSMIKYLRIFFWPLEKIISLITGQGFNLFQTFILWSKYQNSDLIFAAGDSAALPVLFFKKIGLIKPPIVYLSIALFSKAKVENKPSMIRNFYKYLFSGAGKIVVFSKIEEKKFRQFGAENLSHIPLGIDTDFFNPKSTPLENFILAVGRDLDRDYKFLFSIASQLPLKTVVVTSPRNIEGLSIPENIEVMFDQSYEKLRDLYARAKMVVIPLKKTERANGQLVFLESLAMGKKIVASNVVGITSGYEKLISCASLVTHGNKELFLKAINENLKSNLSNVKGREEVMNNYNSEALANNLEKIFKEVIENEKKALKK